MCFVTDRQTDRHADHNTPLPAAAVWGLVLCCPRYCVIEHCQRCCVTDRQTDRQTCSSQYSAACAAVWGLVLCCPRYCVTDRQTDRQTDTLITILRCLRSCLGPRALLPEVLCDRQTDRQTDRHAHHNTPLSAAAVWGLVLCCLALCCSRPAVRTHHFTR